MINLGLRASEQRELNSLLLTSHAIRINVQMLDLNHGYIGSISRRFLGGSVNIDTTASVTRSLKMELLDPDHSLNLDPTNPNVGAMYMDRMIAVDYGVGRLDGSLWFDIPVFTGPVTKVDRDGVVLNVEAQGKDILSKDNVWNAKTYGKGWARSSLIASIMRDLAGERFMRFTHNGSKTARQTVIDREKSPIVVSRTLARGGRQDLFYDGDGYLRLRNWSSTPVWTFDGNSLLSDPQVGYQLDEVFNAVEVTGGTPKGKKKAIFHREVAQASHPLSPVSLARGGIPRYIPHIINDTSIIKQKDAQLLAQRALAQGLLQSVEASFNAFVIPYLEEGDTFTVSTDKYYGQATVRQATIPLQPGEPMSMGYLRRVKPSRLSRKLRRI